MTDDITLNKAATIERCVKRIREDYKGFEDEFETDYTRQDAIILNLQRACEASIDLANHWVRFLKLGIPQTSRESFSLLVKGKILPESLSKRLQSMVSFRNIAVHDYTRMNLVIVRKIIEVHLDEFLEFTKTLIKASAAKP
jgi:uncharacterized protein YutE (UPF0331/DUF86 family)